METAHADTGDGFRADIQGLRAIAVLGVLLFHSHVPFLQGGFVGVDVFYVISGFLITGLMLRDTGDGARHISIRQFYARRIRRILPAATVVLLATLVGAVLILNGIEVVRAASDGRAAALFYSNNHFVGNSDYFFSPNGPSLFQQYWSLSVEEQFYAVWPLLFLALTAVGAVRLRRRVLAISVAVVCAASFALSLTWTYDDTLLSRNPSRAFYLLPSRAWELGLGVLLAILAPTLVRLTTTHRQALTWGGLGAIAASLVLFDETTKFPGWAALVPVVGTAAVIAAGTGGTTKGPLQSALASPPSQLAGRYSYSLYLWHWPILLLIVERVDALRSWPAQTAAMLALSIPAAVVTYHLVENPVRNAKPLRANKWASVGLGVAIIAASLVIVTAADMRGRDVLDIGRAAPASAIAKQITIEPTDYVPSNMTPSLADAGQFTFFGGGECPSFCVIGDAASTDRILLMGDSHAEHYIPGLEVATKELGLPMAARTFRACPTFRIVHVAFTKDCDSFEQATFRELKAHPPRVLLISTRQDRDFAASREAWEKQVRRVVAQASTETKVVLISATPVAPKAIPACLADHLRNAKACDQHWPVEIDEALQAIATDTGASYLDMRPALCNDTRCPAITGNRLIYGDALHFIPKYSAALGPWLAEQLRPLAFSL